MIRFILNEKEQATNLPPGMLLLDYIRYHRHLMGTKIGCREGDCGACTVLIGELKEAGMVYSTVTSCLTALANVEGKHVVTIEGINGKELNPIQQVMSDEAATQCGFCTPGFVVSLAGFCLSEGEATLDAAIASINGNICRCTGYKSIERAAAKVSAQMQKRGAEASIDFVVGNNILPAYFKDIGARLKALPTNGQQAVINGSRFLGGGTDLYVQQPEAMVHTDVVALVANKELKGIHREGATCIVGAAATVTDILASTIFQNHFPDLKKFIKLVSSTPIRNIATVAGNFVNASPIGDLTIFFLALDAKLILSDGQNDRTVALKEFYKGYKKLDKQDGEFVKAICFDLPARNSCFSFEKVSKRTHLDIASVNSAMLVEVNEERITKANLSAGGVGPIPLYLKNTATFLQGKKGNEETVLETLSIAQAEISPISDVRGSEEYKRLLLRQLMIVHFLKAFPFLNVEALLNKQVTNGF